MYKALNIEIIFMKQSTFTASSPNRQIIIVHCAQIKWESFIIRKPKFEHWYLRCCLVGTPKHVPIQFKFCMWIPTTIWNKGSLVEQHYLKEIFLHVTLDHSNLYKTSLKSNFWLLKYTRPFSTETHPLYNDTKIIIVSQS